MKRRALLLGTAGGAAFLAGCAAAQPPGTDSDPDRTDDSNPRDDDGGNGEPPADVWIETTWADCGNPDDDTAVAFAVEDGIRVVGATQAPNPCHEATVESIDEDEGAVILTFGAASTLADDEECVQCHGTLGYELTLDRSPDDIDAIIIESALGDRHELSIRPNDDVPAVGSVEIETRETRCRAHDDGEWVSSDRVGELIKISGQCHAPTPCYEATVVEATIVDDVLDLTIGVVEVLDESESCIQCTGTVEYEAVIGLVGAALVDSVRIDYEDGGTDTIAVDAASESG